MAGSAQAMIEGLLALSESLERLKGQSWLLLETDLLFNSSVGLKLKV